MPQLSQQNRDRMKSAAGVAIFHALLLYALTLGLGVDVGEAVREEMKMFDVFEEPPPPPAEPPPPEAMKESRTPKPKDPEGAAAPPALKNTPTQIVAPKPEIRLKVPPPIPAAPVPGQGSAPAAGAAPVPGPGTGRGGTGTGLGSGMSGSGTGGGGGLGRASPVRWLSGRIVESDYPDAAYNQRISGVVGLRFVVAPDGRVSDCAVTRSSGSRLLDETTCRLIRRRFRYRPARDATGRPIPATIRGEHAWEIGPEPPVVEVEGELVEE